MISLRTSLLLCGLSLAAPALAHHSANMFDPSKQVVLEATVKEFQWSNPHIWIQVMVPNAKGVEEEWSIEGGSPNLVGRQGWKRNSFKAGEKVLFMHTGGLPALHMYENEVLGRVAVAD
jgi:hypothetical protein